MGKAKGIFVCYLPVQNDQHTGLLGYSTGLVQKNGLQMCHSARCITIRHITTVNNKPSGVMAYKMLIWIVLMHHVLTHLALSSNKIKIVGERTNCTICHLRGSV